MNAMFWVLAHTPLRMAWGLSWMAAWLWWTIVPFRKSVALTGFRRAFPERRPGPDLRRTVAGVVLGYFELFREMRIPGTVKLECHNQESIRAEFEAKNGFFLLGGHFGAWDLVSVMLCRDAGFDISVTVKTPRNPAVAAQIEVIRETFGMGLLPVSNCMEAIRREVNEGRQVAFLLDQRFNRGIPVPFLGAPAWTSPGLASAAKTTGQPVYTVFFKRIGIAHHVAEFAGPLELSGDIEADLRVFTEFYEDRIRQLPHGWFWLHDRWKAGAPPAQ